MPGIDGSYSGELLKPSVQKGLIIGRHANDHWQTSNQTF
jgi:hypothetical protein